MTVLQKRLDALTAELAEANYWRHNYADAVKEAEGERDAMTADRDRCLQKHWVMCGHHAELMVEMNALRQLRDAMTKRAEAAEDRLVALSELKMPSYNQTGHQVVPRHPGFPKQAK